MSIVTLVDGMIDIIQKNLISKTNLVSNALTGEVLINVENSFHFSDNQEIIIIDYGYNVESSPHYGIYEYAVIKEVNNTHWITLDVPVQDPNGGWMISDHAFIQKTIGHSPLYDDRVYYGDREVIPTEEMAVTVEPVSISNEWIYIHGGLSEEYRVSIVVYGKDIETEEGLKILNKYTDAIYSIFNRNIHIDVDNVQSPLLANVAAGSTTIVIEDNSSNRNEFKVSTQVPDDQCYEIQDNYGTEIDLYVNSVSTPGDGKMYLTVYRNDPVLYGIQPLNRSYTINEYAVFRKHGVYFYDSRIDSVDIGMVQKGSAFIRAAKLNWFGKTVSEYKFPQKSLRGDYFQQITDTWDVSSSSSNG